MYEAAVFLCSDESLTVSFNLLRKALITEYNRNSSAAVLNVRKVTAATGGNMTKTTEKTLEYVLNTLREAEQYVHAIHVLNFDLETICPSEAMQEQGEVIAFLSDKAYRLQKQKKFILAGEYLYEHRDELCEYDKVLAESLHRNYIRTKNITPAMNNRFDLIYNKAFVDWVNAKQSDDYSLFRDSLGKVRDAQLKMISLNGEALPIKYDNLLSIYDRGMTTEKLDEVFGECKDRLIPLLEKIKKSRKKIRTDFLSRPVSDEQQRQFSQYLLEVQGYDFTRGAFTTTEHPFTDGLGRNDARVTTHYYPDALISSMYSIIHEGGHALFEQNFPREHYDHFIYDEKTMSQHESVSRFYENRIGRSQAYIDLIWDKACEIFPNVFYDVTPLEFYEAINVAQPSLIRTEADEFTYTFHIIIRYEMEKEIINNKASIRSLPSMWKKKYRDYLGVVPKGYADGILQDVHWSSGFGYFPTYAMGNMYNAMYYNKMAQTFDIDSLVRNGDFATINGWMKENVWKKADLLTSEEWIKDITGREFTAKDFLDYLEDKYTRLYEL